MLRVLLPVLMVITACTQVIIAPTDTPVPEPTVDVAATVEAMVAERVSTPTVTVAPTPLPSPTWTPRPTDTPTPAPSPTWTPRPTDTPTPLPSPTWTPVPTWTPEPTWTPVPTATYTPTPTASPKPTPTFTPAPKATPSLEAMVSEARQSVVYISTPSGTGTGFIVDSAKGYILTNQHVVKDYRDVNVVLYDGTRVSGRVKASDATRDIALIEMNSSVSFPALSFATSVRLGEPVVVLGYPLGYYLGSELTVTRGIVSSFRNFEGVDHLQTDAATNPGNSGGPWLNMEGKVVGMHRATLSGEYEGLNFAVRYNVLASRLPAMIAHAEAPATPTPTASAFPPNYGPVGGSIEHEPDSGLIDGFSTEFWMTNGIVQATFYNPYPQSVGEWSNGFLLRNSGFGTYHVILVRSNGYWEHNQSLGSVEEIQYLDSDYSRHISIREGEYNVIMVSISGNEGVLFVNDEMVATLDLSGLMREGKVSAIASYYTTDGIAGYSTRFEDLKIWRAG